MDNENHWANLLAQNIDQRYFQVGFIAFLGLMLGMPVLIVLLMAFLLSASWLVAFCYAGGVLAFYCFAWYFLFELEVKGKRVIKLVNIPALHELVLMRLISGPRGQESSRDRSIYRSLKSGYGFYSPLFWAEQATVSMQQEYRPQKPIEVNASDMVLVGIDYLLRCQVTDSIAFFMNVKGDLDGLGRIVRELVHVILETATSSSTQNSSVPGGFRHPPLAADASEDSGEKLSPEKEWPTAANDLANLSQVQRGNLSEYVTEWLMYFLEKRECGAIAEVRIGTVTLPRAMQQAQQTKAAATLESDEKAIAAKADAGVIGTLISQAGQSMQDLPGNPLGEAIKVLGDVSSSPEQRKEALAILAKAIPDPTILAAVAVLKPVVGDFMERLPTIFQPKQPPSSKGKNPGKKSPKPESEGDEEDE